MMKPIEFQLNALKVFLSGQEVDYAILGGIAVFLFGEPRLTMDVDVNIMLSKRDIGKFLKNGRPYGFLPATPETPEIGKKTGIIPVKFARGRVRGRFDFILAENVLENNAIARAKAKKIGSVAVKVITPEDLVIHKITSERPRDLEDIPGVLMRQSGKLDLRYIRKWLKTIDTANTGAGLLKKFNRLLKKSEGRD